MTVKKNVSNCVRELRGKAGLTQEDIARQAGVSRQTINALEKGNYTPSVDLALRLARIFSTSVETIFYHE